MAGVVVVVHDPNTDLEFRLCVVYGELEPRVVDRLDADVVEVRELGTGVSRRETLGKMGLRNIFVAEKIGLQDGIDRVRTLFPKFYFDEEKCQKLHETMFNYRRDWDTKMGDWKKKPRHDENSHFADAVRTLGVSWREHFVIPEEEEAMADQSFF